MAFFRSRSCAALAFASILAPHVARAETPIAADNTDWPLVIAFNHGRSSPPPELQRLAPDGPWQTACALPCTQRLDPNATYRIGGPWPLDSTDPFKLPQGHVVRVEGDAGPRRFLGTCFAILGFGGMATGGAIMLLPPTSHESVTDKNEGGAIILGAGLVFAALGLAFMMAHANVQVTVLEPGPTDPAKAR